MRTLTRDVVIVGGGAAGIAAAWQLRDMDVLLLEQGEALGGRIKSMPRDDYWLNVGAHLLSADPASHTRRLMADLGLSTLDITGSKTALAFDGRVRNASRVELYPLTLPLSLRERAAMARAGLKIRLKAREWAAATRPRPGEPEEARRARVAQFESGRTFGEFLGPLPEPVDAIFRAVARRSPAELEELSAGAAIMIFGALWVSKTDTAPVNVAGGPGRIGEAVARRLGPRVVTRARVSSVESDGDAALIRYDTASGLAQVRARRAIVAVPAPAALSVARGLPPAVETSLRSITYGPFVAMASLTRESGPQPWDRVYAVLTPGLSFNMLFNQAGPARGAGPRRPGGSLMCYAGGEAAVRMLALPDAEVERRFRADLGRVYPGLDALVGEAVIQRWPLGNCWRSPSTDTTALREYARDGSRPVQLAGDYFGELGGTVEDAARSGVEAAQRVAASLFRPRPRPATALPNRPGSPRPGPRAGSSAASSGPIP